ncbi:MAG TPA: acetyl-CoA acetyltransferase [Acidimicrobiales bacterium]|nr:acetyl-CoA acetyltransferase [Acidimicrobiales bacterium]
MSVDPRSPVLVGAGQFVQRPENLEEALEPVAMMAEAVAAAAADSGAEAIAGRSDLVAVVKGAWRYADPGRLIAERFGASEARTAITGDGGNTPQSVINRLAARIAAGQLDVAVLVGAEGIWSRRRMRAAGVERAVTQQPADARPDEVIGSEIPMSSENERARGFELPVHFYPTFESAVRHDRGETIEEHRVRISQLWARFNAVAVANPYAWYRKPMTAEEIRTPSPDNRMVGFPYTKAMNSNWDLDQAAAVILCSAGAAEAAGVPRDRWVFLHAGADAHDTLLVSNRWSLGRSPAIRAAGGRVLELAGVGADDLAHVDLYSCFPSAVQVAAAEIGLAEDRQLTVTGGLTFAGGPLNNYVTHSVATMAGVLRSDPGSVGLVTANGGYLTKHAMGVYSTEPPPAGYRWDDVQPQVDAEPTRESVDEHEGAVEIEAYTVMHGREGPEKALVACLLPDGRRAWGNTTDADTMVAMTKDEFIGRPAQLAASGEVRVG